MIDPDRIFRGFMADCFADVSAQQWRRRAEQIRAARPRPGDFTGQAAVEQLRDQWRRLTEVAAACEARARFLEAGHQEFPEVAAFELGGVDGVLGLTGNSIQEAA